MVDEHSYRRTIAVGGVFGTVEVWPARDRPQLLMRVLLPRYEPLMQVVERIRRIFDLGADPLQIRRFLQHQDAFATLLGAHPGLRVPGAWDPLEIAVRAVLGQRLVAVDPPAVIRRIIDAWGTPVSVGIEGLSHLFPTADTLADAQLEGVGVPTEKATTIRLLANASVSGRFDSSSYSDLGELLEHLRAIPGLDDETAGYIAMRGFGEPDALCDAALLLRKVRMPATHAGGRLLEWPEVFEKCRPWRAYAAMLLETAITGPGGRPRKPVMNRSVG